MCISWTIKCLYTIDARCKHETLWNCRFHAEGCPRHLTYWVGPSASSARVFSGQKRTQDLHIQHTLRQTASPPSRNKTALKFTAIGVNDPPPTQSQRSRVWLLGQRDADKISQTFSCHGHWNCVSCGWTVCSLQLIRASMLEGTKEGELTTPTDTAEKGASLLGVRGCQVYAGQWVIRSRGNASKVTIPLSWNETPYDSSSSPTFQRVTST